MKRESISRYCYYALVIAVALGIYLWQGSLSDGIVKTFLTFYTSVVEMYFGNYHYYDDYLLRYVGYSYAIGRECLGLGIVALIFGCSGILCVKAYKGYKRAVALVLSATLAALSGIFANIIRIISSIYFISFARFEMIHALLGITIYLAVLFAYYRLFIWIDGRASHTVVRDENVEDRV